MSIRPLLARAAVAVVASAALLGLAACGSPSGQTLPPVIVDLGEIDGTTVEVAEGNSIDLTGDDTAFTEWSAEIADPTVVSFIPGKDDGSAQFNPGLEALRVGTTAVTLENAASGESVAFTVEVVAKP